MVCFSVVCFGDVCFEEVCAAVVDEEVAAAVAIGGVVDNVAEVADGDSIESFLLALVVPDKMSTAHSNF